MKIVLSKKGIRCLWERGGAYTNIGESVIIAGSRGEKKKPLFINRRGHLACQEHALVPVVEGDHVVVTKRWREQVTCSIYKIKDFVGDEAELDEVCKVSSTEELVATGLAHLKAAVEAAINKAHDYHCREAYYIKGE